MDNVELGRRFRDSYVRGVRRLINAGVLKYDDPAELITILDEVQACDWVVYIQPPPQETSDPADVLKDLARYMTGGPISDRRLIEVKDGRVFLTPKDRSLLARSWLAVRIFQRRFLRLQFVVCER